MIRLRVVLPDGQVACELAEGTVRLPLPKPDQPYAFEAAAPLLATLSGAGTAQVAGIRLRQAHAEARAIAAKALLVADREGAALLEAMVHLAIALHGARLDVVRDP